MTRAPGLSRPSGEAAAPLVHEPHWPAVLAIFAVLGLYLALPDKLTLGPTWVVPALEGILLVPLALVRPHRTLEQSSRRRRLAIALTALVTAANAASLALLLHDILSPGGNPLTGRTLVFSAIGIWVTNVVVFALWFWELDRGGPAARCGQVAARAPDFLFPQMSSPDLAPARWRPTFVDYAFVSFTNASAFSPTDTMPLSGRAKALMLAESAVSIVTVVLVASRAVNVLA